MLLKAKKDIVARKFGDKYILVAMGDLSDELHSLITINSTGEFIFSKLKDSVEYEDLLNSICDNYEIDRATAKADLDVFLEKARQAGILDE